MIIFCICIDYCTRQQQARDQIFPFIARNCVGFFICLIIGNTGYSLSSFLRIFFIFSKTKNHVESELLGWHAWHENDSINSLIIINFTNRNILKAWRKYVFFVLRKSIIFYFLITTLLRKKNFVFIKKFLLKWNTWNFLCNCNKRKWHYKFTRTLGKKSVLLLSVF